MKLVLLTKTGPEVYVDTMNEVLSDYYDSLVDTMNHMKSLWLKDHPGENVADCCDVNLVDVECIEISGAFKTDHLGYITITFDNTSNYIFHLWTIQKYKDVMEFIKKLRVCDMDVLSQEDLITYESFVQEATQEYRDLVD